MSILNGIFGGGEVVISEMFAAELPDRTNIRLYVQQTLANGKLECYHFISRSYCDIFLIEYPLHLCTLLFQVVWNDA